MVRIQLLDEVLDVAILTAKLELLEIEGGVEV